MEKKNGKGIRKITEEAATKIMKRERKEFDSLEHRNKIENDLRLIASYVEVLWGYLSNEDGNIGALDNVHPFMEEFRNKVDAIDKDFLKFQEDLSRTGRLNSHFDTKGQNVVFVKNEVKTKRIPMAR